MRKWIRLVLAVIFLALAVVAGTKIYAYLREAKQSADVTQSLAQSAVTAQSAQTDALPEAVESPAQKHMTDAPENAPQPLIAPIEVDFGTLWKTCADIKAWLYCADTPIQEPVVQSADNEYYLRRLPDGTYNRSGTLFLDYRCASDFTDAVSVIYGHNMQNDSMFGTLVKYQEQAYYDAHPCLWLITPERSFRLDVIAGASVDAASEIYTLDPAATSEIIEHSTFETDAAWSEDDRFVILSTCTYTYSGARYVLLCRAVSEATD